MAKTIPLTRGKVAIVDDEDYERVRQFNWYALKGYKGKFYAVRSVPDSKTGKYRKFLYMHRFLLPDCEAPRIDHEDGDGLNNQKYNLRPCTPPENAVNTGVCVDNTSGFKGVSWHALRSKWRARVRTDSGEQHLGLFVSAVQAAHAYDAAVLARYGVFAQLNFPPLPATAGMLEGLV